MLLQYALDPGERTTSLIDRYQLRRTKLLQESALLAAGAAATQRLLDLRQGSPGFAHRLDLHEVAQLLLNVETIARTRVDEGRAKQTDVAVEPQRLGGHAADPRERGDRHVFGSNHILHSSA
jgi:hypothetical protein